jgi:hypothetical protein
MSATLDAGIKDATLNAGINGVRELTTHELDAVSGGIRRSVPNGRPTLSRQWETRTGERGRGAVDFCGPHLSRDRSGHKVRSDVGCAMRDPVAIKRIKDLNSSPAGNTAEEFRQVIKDDLETFRCMIPGAK